MDPSSPFLFCPCLEFEIKTVQSDLFVELDYDVDVFI